jgi:hypothetical protein
MTQLAGTEKGTMDINRRSSFLVTNQSSSTSWLCAGASTSWSSPWRAGASAGSAWETPATDFDASVVHVEQILAKAVLPDGLSTSGPAWREGVSVQADAGLTGGVSMTSDLPRATEVST